MSREASGRDAPPEAQRSLWRGGPCVLPGFELAIRFLPCVLLLDACHKRLDVRSSALEGVEVDLVALAPADGREQRAVDPVDDRAVVLTGATEALVLLEVGDEDVEALQDAEGV